LKNQALLLGAEGATALLRFFGIMRDAPKVAAQLDAATQRAAERFNLPKERIEGMTSNEIIRQAEVPTRSADLAGRRFARDELLNLREEFNKLNAVNVTKPAAVFKGISEGAKTAKKDVDNLVDSFLGGLEKQLASLENKKIELRFGEAAGLSASLDAQLAAFKDSLKDKQIPIPKGLDEFFASLKTRIVAANDELRQMQFEMARIDEAAKGASQDSAEWLTATEEMAKRAADSLAKLEPAFRDLQKNLAVEILPPDQQATARVIDEFRERVQAINEWRAAAIAAGQDVAKANAEAGQATADAWTAATDKMKNSAEDTSEFTRRAFERGFDAVSDGLKDVLDNGVSSFEDFAEKIRKIINSLVADFLTQQLKTLALGQNFGNQGAGGSQVGGLLGQLIGLFGGGGGGAPTSQIAGAFDFELLAGLYHGGGSVHPGGGPSGSRKVELIKMHSGGDVPVMLQTGEYVLNRTATAGIGRADLDYANRNGRMPWKGETTVNFIVQGATDADSFRRSKSQILADLTRAVHKGQKNL